MCDEVIFYDKENGFIIVSEIDNNKFNYTNGYRPEWLKSIKKNYHYKSLPIIMGRLYTL